jgi:nickel/cobalt exporter
LNQTVLTTIAVTGFGIAFFHSAIPTHWLPFVLAARVQRWSAGKTLLITAGAGTGHTVVTAILGLLITVLGQKLNREIGHWFAPVAGALLVVLGLYYLGRQFFGKGHVHFGYPHEHFHQNDHEHDHGHVHDHDHGERPGMRQQRTSDRAAIVSLLAFLTLSPCEAFLPIYVSGIRFGWAGFALLTAILSIGTVAGMMLFTSLTLAGLGRLKLAALENHESVLIGALLCTVGLLVLFFEH